MKLSRRLQLQPAAVKCHTCNTQLAVGLNQTAAEAIAAAHARDTGHEARISQTTLTIYKPEAVSVR
jgi:hypothetical protein